MGSPHHGSAWQVSETEALVRTLLAMEACRVNLHHPDFRGNPDRLTLLMEEARPELAASSMRRAVSYTHLTLPTKA